MTQESAEENNDKRSGAFRRVRVFVREDDRAQECFTASLSWFRGDRQQMGPESRNRCQISLRCGWLHHQQCPKFQLPGKVMHAGKKHELTAWTSSFLIAVSMWSLLLFEYFKFLYFYWKHCWWHFSNMFGYQMLVLIPFVKLWKCSIVGTWVNTHNYTVYKSDFLQKSDCVILWPSYM